MAVETYEKLGLRESMRRAYEYPLACTELSSILRKAYTKLPKNLQSLLFQDTLTAFRLLPFVDGNHGISAANLLLQAAEATLPKQKRALAVTEFKHAAVAHKRRPKPQQDDDGGGSVHLPQDVLLLIFSFLDMRSLVVVGLVCRSWNSAASENKLWQLQYALFFGKSDIHHENEELIGGSIDESMTYQKKEGMDSVTHHDWKETFKRKYTSKPSWRSTSIRGYCGSCKSLFWLSNIQCTSLHCTDRKQQPKIKPVSPEQVVEYLLGESLSADSSSDSDSDSDREPFSEKRLPKLWAYPRRIGSYSTNRRYVCKPQKAVM